MKGEASIHHENTCTDKKPLWAAAKQMRNRGFPRRTTRRRASASLCSEIVLSRRIYKIRNMYFVTQPNLRSTWKKLFRWYNGMRKRSAQPVRNDVWILPRAVPPRRSARKLSRRGAELSLRPVQRSGESVDPMRKDHYKASPKKEIRPYFMQLHKTRAPWNTDQITSWFAREWA